MKGWRTKKAYWGNHFFNMTVGFLGMVTLVGANLIPIPAIAKEAFLIGSLLLWASAILEKQKFFIIMQAVATTSLFLTFIGAEPLIKTIVPGVLSILAIGYFICCGDFKDYLTKVGCLGLLFLAAGYAIFNPLIYLVGGIALAFFSWGAYKRGSQLAIWFTILNVAFVFTSSYAAWQLYM